MQSSKHHESQFEVHTLPDCISTSNLCDLTTMLRLKTMHEKYFVIMKYLSSSKYCATDYDMTQYDMFASLV